MRILYIYKSIALLGGMERVLTDKMNYLSDKLGYDIYLITYEQGSHPFSYPLSSNIKYISWDILFYKCSKYPFLKRILSQLRLRRIFKHKLHEAIKNINPDIIVVTNHSYPQLDIIVNAPGDSKRVLETHISHNALLKSSEYGCFTIGRMVARICDWYQMHQMQKYDVLVTLTEDDKKKWENFKNVVVIPNILTFYPERVAQLDEKKIISVGRLEGQKGYDLLILAWRSVVAKHPDWQIQIFGDGNCKATLQIMINEAHIEDSFILKEATSDIYAEYVKHSIYVMSSRYEGFGLVLIEAMSSGLPCISFDCPSGPSEIISDGEDGILVKNGDIDKLSESICYLIENEKERKRMGRNARQNSLRYTKEQGMQQWDGLFKTLSKK